MYKYIVVAESETEVSTYPNHHAANLERSAEMDGEKKYSPPLGTTQVGSGKLLAWSLGSVPTMARTLRSPTLT